MLALTGAERAAIEDKLANWSRYADQIEGARLAGFRPRAYRIALGLLLHLRRRSAGSGR
jgi:hypothetical protein